jgi:hypothetical protein
MTELESYRPSRLEVGQQKAAQELSVLVGRVVERGVGPLSASVAYAEDRLAKARVATQSDSEARETAITRIIRESVAAAGTTGFVTGLGGIATMPVSLPANLGGNLVINARMVGAIAHLRGYDPADSRSQAMILLVVGGSSLEKIVAEFGTELAKQALQKVGMRAAWQVINVAPVVVVNRIGVRAGYLIVAKYTVSRGAVAVAKAAPLVGGLVGGAVDASFTRGVGQLAKKAFPTVE